VADQHNLFCVAAAGNLDQMLRKAVDALIPFRRWRCENCQVQIVSESR